MPRACLHCGGFRNSVCLDGQVSDALATVEVRAVTDTFLSLADEAAPGLVEGLYLHGSIGFE